MKKHSKQTDIEDYVNPETGQIGTDLKLNQIVETITIRPDGTKRIQWGYENCPSQAEQHTAHLTDINYLMSRYQPDELAAYIAARSQYRVEILGHDFSSEPNLQDAKNMHYNLKQEYLKLPEEIRDQFQSHVEFLKFMDNPANQEKMIKMGLMTKKEIQKATGSIPTNDEKPKNDETKIPPTKTENKTT